jgi:hypothetical protein
MQRSIDIIQNKEINFLYELDEVEMAKYEQERKESEKREQIESILFTINLLLEVDSRINGVKKYVH